jgi:TIR domain/Interferon-induced transmembrane protein
MANKIFISYAREDEATVGSLNADLVECGHEPYFDGKLTGGREWWSQILDEIDGCDLFMPVLSQDYRESEACTIEAQYAEALGKSPVVISTTSHLQSGQFTHWIAEAEWVHYDPAERASFGRLVRALGAAPPSPDLPDSRPARPAPPITYISPLIDLIQGSAELTRAQQLDIFDQLRSLLNGKQGPVARDLLVKLNDRPDTTAPISRDIQALLGLPGQPGDDAKPDARPPVPPLIPPSLTAPAPQLQRHSHPEPHPTPGPLVTRPKTHMGLAWFAVIVSLPTCFLCPLGLISLYFATQVDKRLNAGNVNGAHYASKRAATWATVALILAVPVLIYGIAAAIASGGNSSS